jgi:SH3-like domain-containing protein
MLFIPNGEQVAVAEAPTVQDLTSQETIAAIDAMLGVGGPEIAPQDVAATSEADSEPDPNLQTAALITPAVEPPSTDLEGAPLIDPTLRPDKIGPSAVNLRAGPSSETASVTVLQPGQAVQIGESDGGWVEVTLGDGTTGWVYSRYLASVSAAAPAEADKASAKSTKTAKAVIKGGNRDLEGRTARIDGALAARARPDGGALTVFRTEPGERVRILDVRGNWIRILTADGSSGWIERAG